MGSLGPMPLRRSFTTFTSAVSMMGSKTRLKRFVHIVFNVVAQQLFQNCLRGMGDFDIGG